MRGALDLFGLALVLFTILVVGPYVKRFTEGYADASAQSTTPEPSTQLSAEELEKKKKDEEEGKKIMEELNSINTLLENPSLQPETKETMLKQKEDLTERVKKLTGVALPQDKLPVEGFQGSLTNGNEYLKNAASVSF